ncbi:MAG TPA: transposase [Ktedonobacteraceae bacterium]|jgi:hypothetical protein
MASAKKQAEQEQRTIVFGEQSALDLLPMVIRTDAPMGQTPVLTVTLTHDPLSVMGGIPPEGTIRMQTQAPSYKGPNVVRFVPLLTREIPGNMLVIWDGAPMHRGQAAKDSLAQGGAKRIHRERLLASAPELHPQESRSERRKTRSEAASAACSFSLMETTKA